MSTEISALNNSQNCKSTNFIKLNLLKESVPTGARTSDNHFARHKSVTLTLKAIRLKFGTYVASYA